MRRLILAAALTVFSTCALGAEPHTEAAVVIKDKAWLDAELTGDATKLNQILLPDYVTISASGHVTGRSELIAKVRTRTQADLAKQAALVRSWDDAHPARAEVIINRDTAFLKWVSARPGQTNLFSCDIFLYRGGRWRAVYSQHSSAS